MSSTSAGRCHDPFANRQPGDVGGAYIGTHEDDPISAGGPSFCGFRIKSGAADGDPRCGANSASNRPTYFNEPGDGNCPKVEAAQSLFALLLRNDTLAHKVHRETQGGSWRPLCRPGLRS